MQTKICAKCNVEKSVDLFYFKKDKDKIIIATPCKECIRLKGKYALGYEKPLDLPNEEWRDIPGYEGYYQASNFCRIKSIERQSWNGVKWITQREIIMTPSKNDSGYSLVCLSKNRKLQSKGIHVWTAMAFLGHVPCGFEVVVDHVDDNPENNVLSNLQLLTNRQNVDKGFKRKNLTSQYTGVYFNKNVKKFRVSICIKGTRQVHLGYFKDDLDAHYAYETAFNNLDKYEDDTQFRELVKQLNKK